jgi:hypothetical protein
MQEILVNVQIDESKPTDQLRAIYLKLMIDHDHFDEFRAILASYPLIADEAEESEYATGIRLLATERAREWTGIHIERLSSAQMLVLRDVLVDQRRNIAASPWQESNMY